MAIPGKCTLGVYARWLGVLLFAALGVVVISKSKLLRASVHMRAAIAGILGSSTCRSLVGMLEHFVVFTARRPSSCRTSTKRTKNTSLTRT
eukprot:6190641-Pleurochrysis_carterae.AAC.1